MQERLPFTFLPQRGRQPSARSSFIAVWAVSAASVTVTAVMSYFALSAEWLGATSFDCCASCVALLDVTLLPAGRAGFSGAAMIHRMRSSN